MKTTRKTWRTKKSIALIGTKFNKLTITGFSPKEITDKHENYIYECQCECGKTTYSGLSELRTNRRISCGCSKPTMIHKGFAQKYPREMRAYRKMNSRCYCKTDKDYYNYGERGIMLCDRWKKGEDNKTGFMCFLEDMGPRPSPQHSVDRKNNYKNYEPNNCRWATPKEQANNRKDKARILAIDPGQKNYALALIDNGFVQSTRMLENTITHIKQEDFKIVFKAYEEEIETILDTLKPDIVIIERFVVRGFGTNLIELVTMMIGLLYALCAQRKIPCRLVMSLQWKRPFKQYADLKKLYKDAASSYDLPPHIVDACLMGKYMANDQKFYRVDSNWIRDNLKNALTPMPVVSLNKAIISVKPRFYFQLRNNIVF